MTDVIREKFNRIRGALNGTFVDRAPVVDGLLLALLTRQHVLLMGPPGTGKSALANAVTKSINGGKCFAVLLTRTTVPEEVFGPVDLLAFDQGRFERRMENYLPAAHVAFLDEIWRGSSAILNGLLTAINEREVEVNGVRQPIPLRSVVAATNSLPESDDLHALDDRFTLRYVVGSLDRHGDRVRLLKLKADPTVPERYRLSLAELDAAHEAVKAVAVPEDVFNLAADVWQELATTGHYISERRFRALVTVMKAHAWLDGRDTVSGEDLEVLADSVWRKPAERSEVLATVYRHSCPSISKAVEMFDVAIAAFNAIPARDGRNDVAVATKASEAKKQIKTVLADLEGVIARAGAHEQRRLTEFKGKIEGVRDDVTRKLGEAIAS